MADLDETSGFLSDKPPEASYTAHGPQKQPEIVKHILFMSSSTKQTGLWDLDFGFRTFGGGSREVIPLRF